VRRYHLLSACILIVALGRFLQSTTADEPKSDKNPIVEMKTSMGTIRIELFPEKAPFTVKNFLNYVDDKFYDGTLFHRVIATFMIQGGGFDNTEPMREKRMKPPIRNEAANGLKNDRGTIAMARESDPDTATSEFFINVVDNERLNRPKPDGHGYAVFGRVIEGMDVVDKIRQVKTDSGRAIIRVAGEEKEETLKDVPQTRVVIQSVRRLQPK